MWIKLTTAEGDTPILVNMDQVMEVWTNGDGSTLVYAFVDPMEEVNSTDVRESPNAIYGKLLS